MYFYDEQSKVNMDEDGLIYVVEMGYCQNTFKNPYDAIDFAITIAKHSNSDTHVFVTRLINQYTGEVIEDK